MEAYSLLYLMFFSQVKVTFLSFLQIALAGIWPSFVCSNFRFIVRRADMCDLAIFPMTDFSCFIKLSDTQRE